MSLVSTDWLEKNIDNVKIIDCSWHMPQQKRNGFQEYLNEHIKNSIFFDLDSNSNKDTDLPHMLVDRVNWEKIVSKMGIKNEDTIVIYDNSDLISSCRCWYNFIYFGHDKNLVKILNGGLKKWKLEKKNTTKEIKKTPETNYKAKELNNLVKTKKQIDENIIADNFKVIDARSYERFNGNVPEPRKGLRSGSIKNSACLPFVECISSETNEFLEESILQNKFKKLIDDKFNNNVIFSCGSGVTAAVLAFSYSLINKDYLPIIYDGSWSEYGKYPS